MSKEKQKSISEEEFREFFDSLPEASKEYLMNNSKNMSHETFVAYITGVIHGMKEVIEKIVEPHIKRTDKILYR